MILSFLCIPHIPVGYAGGRAMRGAIAENTEGAKLFASVVLRGFMS
jgi:hypothetical protein